MEYVIKRNGVKAPFDKSKIVNAIEKAMTTTPGGIDSRVSNAIADYIAEMPDTLSVEQIQDVVIEQLKASPFADVAESYSHWRKLRQEIRDKEKTNASILEIIDAKNDSIKQENSNKNPTVNSVQRDYMAGEISKDLTARLLLDRGLDRTALLTADAAEPKSCADYRAAGLPCRAAVKGPGSVAAGMKWLQSLNAIIIDPMRCPETAAEFTGYEYLRDARTGEVTNAWPDADNHHIDAVRYAVEGVWRRRGS